MFRWSLAFLCLLSLPAFVSADEAPPARWVVVTAPAFRDALETLCKQRRSHGYRVTVVQTSDVLTPKEILAGDAEKLRDQVVKLCGESKGTCYILLVGAVEAGDLTDPEKKVLPPLHGTVGRMKGQFTDHGYGSPGDDLVPGVAVGRFPARSADEAAAMASKTVAFENDTHPGAWRQRLTVLAGVPAFNPLVDRLVENLAMTRLDRIDPGWTGQAIYHNAQSRFCLPDDRLHDEAVRVVEGGQFLTLYLGHSGPDAFYAGQARYLDRDDWAKLRIARGPGVFATFGCLGCQLAGRRGEGYGVAAMRNPGGPVGVIGSHGICFAAMVQLAADGLFQSLAARPPEHLGDLWLAIEKSVANEKIERTTFALLDAVDGDSSIPLETQRSEHLEMFLLLGDPALRLPAVVRDVRLEADEAAAGKPLLVRGVLPERLARGSIRLTLERPVSSLPVDLATLPKTPGEERDRVMLANHARANRFVLATREVTPKDGRFEAHFEVPEKAPWKRLVLRAYVVQEEAEGLGVLEVPVKR